MKVFKVLIFSLSLFLLSCSSSQKKENKVPLDLKTLSLYQMYIDADGNLLSPIGKTRIENEDEYVDKILKNYFDLKSKNKDLELMIFIHGGLNEYGGSTRRAKNILEKELKNILKEGKYPLFISWDSGFLKNYTDHLLFLRRGSRVTNISGPLSSPFILLEDFFRSVVRIPANLYYASVRAATTPIQIKTNLEEAYDIEINKIEVPESERTNFDLNISNSKSDKWKDKSHVFKDFWSIGNPVKLIGAPLSDGFATGAWNSMLRRTDLILTKDITPKTIINFSKINNESTVSKEVENKTAVTKLLDKYLKKEKSQPINKNFTGVVKKYGNVTIIGHSMGAIVANNIISKYQDINFTNIVYMAAASKIRDIEYIISPYLKVNKNTEFYNLSLNPYREINENMAWDFIPRGSLLVYLDSVFTDVNSYQDRMAGNWYNIILAANNVFPEDIRSRVHLTQYGIYEDETKAPQTHGAFDEFKFWSEEFWKAEDKRELTYHLDEK